MEQLEAGENEDLDLALAAEVENKVRSFPCVCGMRRPIPTKGRTRIGDIDRVIESCSSAKP